MKFASRYILGSLALCSALASVNGHAAVEELIDSRFVRAEADPLRGDWQGAPGFVAQVFSTAPGKYTANILPAFDLPDNKAIVVLQGTAAAGVLTFAGDGWTGTIAHGHFIAQKGDATFDLQHVKRASPTMGAPAPQGAVVLVDKQRVNADAWATKDNKNWLNEQPGPAAATIVDDDEGGKAIQLVPGTGGGLISHKHFGDTHLHAEFRTIGFPSNSGIFLQTRYEADINETYGKLDGGVNGNLGNCSPPELVTHLRPTRPVLEWNTFDIDYQAPRFNAAGEKIKNAHVLLKLNGVQTYDIDVAPMKGAAGRFGEAPKGPLYLQEHGMPVQFRNIWVVEK